MKRVSQFAGGLAGAVLLATPVVAADLDQAYEDQALCAVSGFNAKLEGAGGFIDTEDSDGGRGHGALSLSMPLGCMFGLQLDGTAGVLDNEETGGAAAHLFMRDPSSHLIGVYGEYSAVDSNDIGRFGAEGELYLSSLTFSALAGYEDSDQTSSDFFGMGQVAYYITDNFQINGGVAHFLNVTAGTFGAEWQPSGHGLPIPMSLFVEGAVGDNDYATVYGGLRIYFGGDNKSLIRRHREDDPINYLNRLKSLIEEEEGGCPAGTVFVPGEGCQPATAMTEAQ